MYNDNIYSLLTVSCLQKAYIYQKHFIMIKQRRFSEINNDTYKKGFNDDDDDDN